MKTRCPDKTKKEAPILCRDFIYNDFTIFKFFFPKTNAVGPALVRLNQTQLPDKKKEVCHVY